jgi:hypothetical protein
MEDQLVNFNSAVEALKRKMRLFMPADTVENTIKLLDLLLDQAKCFGKAEVIKNLETKLESLEHIEQ